MKKLFALFSMLMLSLSAQAAQFNEGEHYKVLDLEASNKPVVTEFFSFYCPHCNSFEPIIQQLKKQLPEGVKLQKNHVSFMGGSMGPSMSKAFATMVALKVEDKMVPVMFNRIHNLRKAPRDDAELRQIFLDEGVDEKKFDSAFKGFAVDSMVRRMDKQFEDSGLTGVPAVIVNNKYLVQAQSIKTMDEYFALVNYLLELK
ncbi:MULTISPECIES: thiol:disulfide interchange protein DsbA/DsbL [Vibrio]|jgi:thiol:disulfide interchange protein DsbA|uniref:Thiol:disulfide interchange protein n=1 Tax=Vibrio natriegens NBRC 15636 = ATCC 14048 = DSM 759 TaxID=1219067 RepID=A0AAN0Y5A8_VIBNA|nr:MULTISPECIES: thiol:disulfide interchange protein DsbA/DsbL [Vibrio]MEE3880525.1 thiol:disulfide interchange protein DsbA/DsbL [Vibrio sp. YYF0003]AEX23546.1 periplasmic thiol:disulfide interchange protein DsbA [Vibrio sp. EJY3]ALR16920.1 thiol:disulfide interchange protein [Vibrio natriegens NBRC 15636 = ATCC 14048 = DSM 759]ANQ13907.1 thiol:disulfide interchange protein [Vibrio natriegens NBRC 15636 = ATCC 14048 = DSM 759]ANQ18403.1 thiol:disulfide interchange protein [Vibrio natriegens]